MKIRQIEAAGRPFRLAPLTFGQVEEITSERPASHKEGRARALQTIAYAVVNAGGSITAEELKRMLDVEEYGRLHQAVLDLSELKVAEDAPAPADDDPDRPVDYDEIRCFLSSSTTWTFQQIEQTPFPYIVRLCEYFQEFPPTHLLVRGFVGFKPSHTARRRHGGDSSEDERRMFVGMWGGSVLPAAALPPALQLALARMDEGDSKNN